MILNCAEKYKNIITVEEHNIAGGFGGAVAEVLAAKRESAVLISVGLNDTYSAIVGSQTYLRERYGLSAQNIARIIEENVKD